MDCRTALLTVLDQVDYTNGACRVTEMVGAVLPKEVIALARTAIGEEKTMVIEQDVLHTWARQVMLMLVSDQSFSGNDKKELAELTAKLLQSLE